MDLAEKKIQVCDYMRELYSEKFFTDIGGNISIRDQNSFWITPTRIRKNTVTPDQLIEISMENGEILKNLHNLKPSVEWPMHFMIYKQKPVTVILHTHAPYSTAYSVLEKPTQIPHLTAELKILVPKIVVIPYAPSGSYELGEKISEGLTESEVVILKNHGTVSVSYKENDEMVDAIIKTRALEEYFKIFAIAKQMGNEITPFQG